MGKEMGYYLLKKRTSYSHWTDDTYIHVNTFTLQAK